MSLTTDAAWDELHTNIRAFVARRVRQPADADDIVQQVFLRVHQALPTLREADKLHAWMYQMTRRAIADYYRAPAQRREVPAGLAADVTPAEQPAASANDSEESALQELAACLKPLMGTLSSGDQEALRLIEFEGVAQVEAARRVGVSVSGMKSRVQRARLRLRSVLDECCRIALDRRGGVLGYEGRTARCDPAGCPPPVVAPTRRTNSDRR